MVVEVAGVDGIVVVRNTMEPGVELRLTAEQWRSLLDKVKADGLRAPKQLVCRRERRPEQDVATTG